MKIRQGFVSNSSSSSFIVHCNEQRTLEIANQIIEDIEELRCEYNKHNSWIVQAEDIVFLNVDTKNYKEQCNNFAETVCWDIKSIKRMTPKNSFVIFSNGDNAIAHDFLQIMYDYFAKQNYKTIYTYHG